MNTDIHDRGAASHFLNYYSIEHVEDKYHRLIKMQFKLFQFNGLDIESEALQFHSTVMLMSKPECVQQCNLLTNVNLKRHEIDFQFSGNNEKLSSDKQTQLKSDFGGLIQLQRCHEN